MGLVKVYKGCPYSLRKLTWEFLRRTSILFRVSKERLCRLPPPKFVLMLVREASPGMAEHPGCCSSTCQRIQALQLVLGLERPVYGETLKSSPSVYKGTSLKLHLLKHFYEETL